MAVEDLTSSLRQMYRNADKKRDKSIHFFEKAPPKNVQFKSSTKVDHGYLQEGEGLTYSRALSKNNLGEIF